MREFNQHKVAGAILTALVVLMVACGGGKTSPTPSERASATRTPTERPPTSVPTRPVATPSPSPTSALTAIPSRVPTVDASLCELNSAFVSDVTIPDGTALEAGSEFTKTWEIENTGTCTWTVGYQFAHVSGEKLGAPDFVSVPETAPGDSVEFSVPMVAPDEPGGYRSNWRVCIGTGRCFGVTVWVEIVSQAVTSPPTVTGTLTVTETATPMG